MIEGEKIHIRLVNERLKILQEKVTNQKEFEKGLYDLLRAIEPFDIELFRGLLDEYMKESKKIEGQEVFMLIGPTGSGKSTTLHYLSGSSM